MSDRKAIFAGSASGTAMPQSTTSTGISILAFVYRALRLKCPRCGEGTLFEQPFRMVEQCSHCRLETEPEPGFYLGSIYFNYGMTVLLVVPVYVILVLGLGIPRDYVIWPCVGFTTLFPLWFFRYARSLWLSVAWRASSSDFARRTDRGSANSSKPSQRSTGVVFDNSDSATRSVE